jgi:uncharacterized iron-regulated membrane protein
MMRALVLVHRWLGIASCLLLAMWFSTGIVMHFVPFPSLTEEERIAGLAPVDPHRIGHGPAEAVAAADIPDATRVRLLQRPDGPVYLVSGVAVLKALRAGDLTDATVLTEQIASAIAFDHARRRGMDASRATFVELVPFDQWTMAGGFDGRRPLYRIALDDAAGIELYVSSVTGEVVLETTRRQRWWSYAGSIAHWIYPTVLRSRPLVWDAVVWWLSLAALIAAISGALLGTTRIRLTGWRLASPYRGWQAWHHVLGLISMIFVLTWTFSGWLSMDNGRMFSRGRPSDAEAMIVSAAPAWSALPPRDAQHADPEAKELEWFGFGGRIYRRERTGLHTQRLVLVAPADPAAPSREFLGPDDLRAVASRLAPACMPPVAVEASDAYATAATIPGAPVYRLVCGDIWFHLDGANGALLEKLGSSRRAYRWLYGALHTFDIPPLTARPRLRTALILTLCGLGFAFSVTGVVIGWRRLRLQLGSPA